jgi:hypothetical protein
MAGAAPHDKQATRSTITRYLTMAGQAINFIDQFKDFAQFISLNTVFIFITARSSSTTIG